MTAGSEFVPVVDDHWCIALLLSRASSETGTACGRWRTGCRYSSALRDELFDCVPLDVLTPELDGYQVLGHVRSDPSCSGKRR